LYLQAARKYWAEIHQIHIRFNHVTKYSLGFYSRSGWSGSWNGSASSAPGSWALVRVCPCFALTATAFRCCWCRGSRLVLSAPGSWTRIMLQVKLALLMLQRPICQLGLRILGGLESGEGFIVGSFFQVRHVLPDTPNQI
jgi:hypothetical protein